MQRWVLPNPALMLVNIHSAILIYYIQGAEESVCACEGGRGHTENEGRFLYEPRGWSQVLINKTSASVGGSKLEKGRAFKETETETERERELEECGS